MIRPSWPLLLLAGCSEQSYVATGVDPRSCESTPTGRPLASDEASRLGFSAIDLLPLLAARVDVTVLDGGDPGGASERKFDVAFVIRGDSQVVRYARQIADPSSFCLDGDALDVPVTMKVTSEDGWFRASGDGVVHAAAREAAQLWVEAGWAVGPSPDLTEAARARCSGATPTEIRGYQHAEVDVPWSEGLVGGLVAACPQGSTTLFTWDGSGAGS